MPLSYPSIVGPAGPPGPTGATGADGPPGPPGPSGSNLRAPGAYWVNPSIITTPINDVLVQVPYSGTIQGVVIGTVGGTGSCVVDVRKSDYANYPPTVADSICGASLPTISSGIKYTDSTLTGWTTTVTAGDWFLFKLESSSVFTQITIQLQILS